MSLFFVGLFLCHFYDWLISQKLDKTIKFMIILLIFERKEEGLVRDRGVFESQRVRGDLVSDNYSNL